MKADGILPLASSVFTCGAFEDMDGLGSRLRPALDRTVKRLIWVKQPHRLLC
jgi:hypothetical protein